MNYQHWVCRKRTALSFFLALCAIGVSPSIALANDYPTRPITVLVPFGTGGAVQALTERLGPDLRAALGQSMVNDFKGGAGGTIAGETAARAEPNGYTLFLATPSALAAAPASYKSVRYNPLTDFVTVSMVATSPLVMVVRGDLPVRDVRELVAYGKANPGKLNFASAGVGSMDHIAGEIMQKMGNFKMTHIPYKGPGASLQDMVAGRLDVLISSPIPIKPHVDSGKIRVIAVTTPQRSPAMKDVPTIAEGGFPGFEMTNWYGYVGPTGTPPEVINRVNAAVRKALTNKSTLDYMAGFGLTPSNETPEEFGESLKREVKRWQDWVQQTGVRAE